jgi:mono/diheme cytochrome c family protein
MKPSADGGTNAQNHSDGSCVSRARDCRLHGAAGSTLGPWADPSGNAATGQKLFEANCSVCHKSNGKGGVKLGDATSADLDSPALEARYHQDDKLMSRAILDGIDEEGQQLDKTMPRWRGQLTPQQADDLVAYMKTLHE